MTFAQAMAAKINIANQGATPNDCIAAMTALLPQLPHWDQPALAADIADMRQFGNVWPMHAGPHFYIMPDQRRVAYGVPRASKPEPSFYEPEPA